MAEPIASSSSGSTEGNGESTATNTSEATPGVGTSADGMEVEGQTTAEGGAATASTEGTQAEEAMQVQVDGGEQGEDMVIEAGPSHIGKRVKVGPPRAVRRRLRLRMTADANPGLRITRLIMVRSWDWAL
jgi:hypothetical protein